MDPSVWIALISAISTIATAAFAMVIALRVKTATAENTKVVREGVSATLAGTVVAQSAADAAQSAAASAGESAIKVEASAKTITDTSNNVQAVHELVNGHMTSMRNDLRDARSELSGMTKSVAESAKNLATAMERIQGLQDKLENRVTMFRAGDPPQ